MTTRTDCPHCAEGVPLDPDGIMHTHTGSDDWHPAGHVSPCFSAEAYELVHARNEAVIIDGRSSFVREATEALRRAGGPMEIVSVPERHGDALARAVESVRLQLPTIIRVARRVNEPPMRNAGYFADTRRRGRR